MAMCLACQNGTCENVIFRPFITRNGKRIYRADGKMWPIHLRDKAA